MFKHDTGYYLFFGQRLRRGQLRGGLCHLRVAHGPCKQAAENPILNSHMTGAVGDWSGHQALLQVGDQTWIIYHRWKMVSGRGATAGSCASTGSTGKTVNRWWRANHAPATGPRRDRAGFRSCRHAARYRGRARPKEKQRCSRRASIRLWLVLSILVLGADVAIAGRCSGIRRGRGASTGSTYNPLHDHRSRRWAGAVLR